MAYRPQPRGSPASAAAQTPSVLNEPPPAVAAGCQAASLRVDAAIVRLYAQPGAAKRAKAGSRDGRAADTGLTLPHAA